MHKVQKSQGSYVVISKCQGKSAHGPNSRGKVKFAIFFIRESKDIIQKRVQSLFSEKYQEIKTKTGWLKKAGLVLVCLQEHSLQDWYF